MHHKESMFFITFSNLHFLCLVQYQMCGWWESERAIELLIFDISKLFRMNYWSCYSSTCINVYTNLYSIYFLTYHLKCSIEGTVNYKFGRFAILKKIQLTIHLANQMPGWEMICYNISTQSHVLPAVFLILGFTSECMFNVKMMTMQWQ